MPGFNSIRYAAGTDIGLKRSVNEDSWVVGCSDGLTDMVSDETIAILLGAESEPEKIVSRLIEKALANGGRDNVTVIVVQAPGSIRRRSEARVNRRTVATEV